MAFTNLPIEDPKVVVAAIAGRTCYAHLKTLRERDCLHGDWGRGDPGQKVVIRCEFTGELVIL